jgi:phosphoribosyl-AMP cyclohydrolase
MKMALIPAIAQDAQTGRILMVAWMNREAYNSPHKTNAVSIGHGHAKNYGTKAKNQVIFK